jgi:hypothetical protein
LFLIVTSLAALVTATVRFPKLSGLGVTATAESAVEISVAAGRFQALASVDCTDNVPVCLPS